MANSMPVWLGDPRHFLGSSGRNVSTEDTGRAETWDEAAARINAMHDAEDRQGVGIYGRNPAIMGFMPRNDGFPHISRDWPVIDCKAKSCVNCRDEKCSTPSLAVIGDDGTCKGFKTEFKETSKDTFE